MVHVLEAYTCVVFILLFCPLSLQSLQEKKADYFARRTKLLHDDEQYKTGSTIVLTDPEEKVNKILMGYKAQEFAVGRKSIFDFLPSQNFIEAKNRIDKSKVFQMIKAMPKGGVLHVHDIAMVDIKWLVDKTYLSNCYMCISKQGQLQFHFYRIPPKRPDCPWQSVNTLRQQYGNDTAFDQLLYNNMSMVVKNPNEVYTSQDSMWKKFLSNFNIASGLITYLPLFGKYYYQALLELHKDNVQYLEMRFLLPDLYDLDGNIYTRDDALNIYINTTEQFVKDYGDFWGSKFIYTGLRNSKTPTILDDVKWTIQKRKQYPTYLAGYDLVGQEDPGNSLLFYLDDLLYPSQQDPPVKLPYFFHAGETNWEGVSVDENLLDALLLNTTRIGHAYAVVKHPVILELVKDRQIAIEINPISNQVLGLVKDLRNHPGAMLLSQGYPVVISCDDPAMWGATGVSYDYYETFMGLAGENGDLTLLKQLFMDSIRYSAMSDQEKNIAMTKWTNNWNKFINSILHSSYTKEGMFG